MFLYMYIYFYLDYSRSRIENWNQ